MGMNDSSPIQLVKDLTTANLDIEEQPFDGYDGRI
jgi:hypothetical protein